MQNSFSYERFRTKTRFETEAYEYSEMAYWNWPFSVFADNKIESM